MCGKPSLACSLIPIRLPTGTAFYTICRQVGFNVFSLTYILRANHLQVNNLSMPERFVMGLFSYSSPSCLSISLPMFATILKPHFGLRYKPGVPQSYCGFQHESCHILDTTYPSAYVLFWLPHPLCSLYEATSDTHIYISTDFPNFKRKLFIICTVAPCTHGT